MHGPCPPLLLSSSFPYDLRNSRSFVQATEESEAKPRSRPIIRDWLRYFTMEVSFAASSAFGPRFESIYEIKLRELARSEMIPRRGPLLCSWIREMKERVPPVSPRFHPVLRHVSSVSTAMSHPVFSFLYFTSSNRAFCLPMSNSLFHAQV